MYNKPNAEAKSTKPNLTLLKNDGTDKDYKLVDGKWISKEFLNEKLAYFYENGGPVMDI